MVRPKQAALKEAEQQLGEVQSALAEKQAELAEVEGKLAELGLQLDAAKERKGNLEVGVGMGQRVCVFVCTCVCVCVCVRASVCDVLLLCLGQLVMLHVQESTSI